MHFGQSEIQNLQLPARSDHYVGRLDVPVNDAVLVRFGHTVCSLESKVEHPIEVQRTFANCRGQRAAFDVHHDNEAHTAGLSHLVNMGNIGMIQR